MSMGLLEIALGLEAYRRLKFEPASFSPRQSGLPHKIYENVEFNPSTRGNGFMTGNLEG
jgi:hypothetical protein